MNGYVLVDDMTPEAFSAFMDAAPVVAITNNVLNDLARHMHMDMEAVGVFLSAEADRCQKPIAINLPIDTGSMTHLMGPSNWTQDRLMGWAATKKDALEQAFGDIDSIQRAK